MDDEGNPRKGGGETDPDVILRELPFKVTLTADHRAAGRCPHARYISIRQFDTTEHPMHLTWLFNHAVLEIDTDTVTAFM